MKLLWSLPAIWICIFGLNETRGDLAPIVDEEWILLRTPNFSFISNGSQEVTWKAALAMEHFREGYSRLAGTQAAASGPNAVIAFANTKTLQNFLWKQERRPANVASLFQRDFDVNLIVLNLSAVEQNAMELVFHDYARFLFRDNTRTWPSWLIEGMVEVYSAFSVEANQICLGIEKPRSLAFLRQNSMMPLQELFSTTRDSPNFKEQKSKNLFSAQSWSLTHYLMFGDRKRKRQFQSFTSRLSANIPAERAFAESFQVDYAELEEKLKSYVTAGNFEPECYRLSSRLDSKKPPASNPLPKVEVSFQLGKLLLNANRLDEAKEYFTEAQRLFPGSARPLEGLGMLAYRGQDFAQATELYERAIAKGSANARVHYEYARSFVTGSDGRIVIANISPEVEEKARASLQKAIQLAPQTAQPRYLLGILEFRSRPDFAARYLLSAVRLDPNNSSYALALAQVQIRTGDLVSAKRTLNALQAPHIRDEVRERAADLLKSLTK